MIKRNLIYCLFISSALLMSCGDNISKKEYTPPQDLYPTLFDAVQSQHLFDDDKIFADAIPKMAGEKIEEFYVQDKVKAGFSLKTFINEFFIFQNPQSLTFSAKPDLQGYLEAYFTQLVKQPKDDGGSLLPTRNAYVSSGIGYESFNYSSDYFTMRGLETLKKDSLLKGSIINYVQFIQDFGYVPLSNRSYSMNQTALPFLPLMINLTDKNKPEILKYAASQLTKDYQFWMAAEDKDMVAQQQESLKTGGKSFRTVVFGKDNQLLNKLYLKPLSKPRPQYYNEDLANESKTDSLYFTNLRMAEMASNPERWLVNGKMAPNNFMPVDLNAFMYQYEKLLAETYKQKGEKMYAENFEKLAEKRKAVFKSYFWNEQKGFFVDYNFITKKQSEVFSLASVYPLYVGIASAEEAKKVADFIKTYLLKSGGLASSYNFGTNISNNLSSAEMHYIAIESLKKYNEIALAEEIKSRFLKTVNNQYSATGTILEQYDVINTKPLNTSSKYSKTSGAAGAILYLLTH